MIETDMSMTNGLINYTSVNNSYFTEQQMEISVIWKQKVYQNTSCVSLSFEVGYTNRFMHVNVYFKEHYFFKDHPSQI